MRNRRMLYKKIWEGLCGGLEWISIEHAYRAARYIFFPTDDENYNKWGIELLPIYIKKLGIENIVVFVIDKKTEKELEVNRSIKILVKRISSKKMMKLMSFYALVDMSEKWTVISVEQPYETGATRLLNIKGITYRDLVFYDIYGLSEEVLEEYKDEKNTKIKN